MYKRVTPLILVLTLLATACSKAPARQTTNATKSGAPAKVVTIHVGLYDNEPSLDTVIAAFQDKYPQYRVEQVPLGLPINAMDKLKRGEVDVVSDALPPAMLLDEGLITNLDPFIARSRLDLTPYGQALESARVNGHLYGMPAWSEPYVFAYSKQFADAAKMAVPSVTWTWEDFRDLAAHLTSKTGDEKVWGFDPNSQDENLVYMLALQKTAATAMPDAKTYREALQFFKTMVAGDRSMPPALPLQEGASRPPYCYQNQAATCVLKLSVFLKNKQFADFGILPFPASPQHKPVALALLRSYGMLANTAEPEAAWAFLSFISGQEGAPILARQGYFPAYFTDATRQAWLESSPPPPAAAKGLLDASWYTLPRSVDTTTVFGVFVNGARQVLSGAAAVDDVVPTYEAALAKSKP